MKKNDSAKEVLNACSLLFSKKIQARNALACALYCCNIGTHSHRFQLKPITAMGKIHGYLSASAHTLMVGSREEDPFWGFCLRAAQAMIHREEDYQEIEKDRKQVRLLFGWGFPLESGWECIFRVCSHRYCLEVGAGSGFLGSIILHNSQPRLYIATDIGDPAYKYQTYYLPVESKSHSVALQENPSAEVLILSWPPYATSMAYESVRDFKGTYLVYLGEGKGGCTGNHDFFCELETHWIQKETHRNLNWSGTHDSTFVYERKPLSSSPIL